MEYSLSVITINRNNSIGLEKTLKSIIDQTYKNFELIIIDGASVDESNNVINKIISINQNRIRILTISETDSGIYNAMNKGLKYSAGEYIIYLNSGDIFHDNKIFEKFYLYCQNEDVIYGNICFQINGNIKIIKSNSEISFFNRYQHDLPPHPAMFAKRARILEVGGFEEEYKIIADVALISRLFSHHTLSFKWIDVPITIFDLNGISSKLENQMQIYEERKKFILRNYPNYIDDLEKIYKYRKFYFYLSKINLFMHVIIMLKILKNKMKIF